MKNAGLGILLGLLILLNSAVRADEGMWIPMFLKKYNIEDMQKAGFKLSAEDVYSVNSNSLKDAVMIFGGGCTGELISEQGLLITNHHCGYGFIQKHSSLEHDYLTDGFWAMNPSEELVNPGLEVRFLVRMEDVTEAALKEVTENMTESERKRKIDANIQEIKDNLENAENYEIVIKPFYHGNQYFMFLNEVYKDVRLVGAPPSSIGKFGGDTDNWMWPRHTGDFSLFRIYTAPDGSPAEYHETNIPLKAKKHFPISLQGVKPGDFTMVFGYPGSTDEYAPSFELDLVMNVSNPLRIEIRDRILDIMKASMDANPLTRIQYASKAASISNGWKKWIGENRGLKRLNAIERKQTEEAEFNAWAKGGKYENILSIYEENYSAISEYEYVRTAILEILNGIEMVKLASSARTLIRYSEMDVSETQVNESLKALKTSSQGFFKDYDKATSKAITEALLELYIEKIDAQYWPEYLIEMNKKGLNKSLDKLFKKSLFANEDVMTSFLDKYKGKAKTMENDPVYQLYQDFISLYLSEINPVFNKHQAVIDSLDRIYMQAQMEFRTDKVFYPDANFTLRVAYGNVDNYFPRDAVKYEHATSLEGIMEKDNPEIYDYDVPDKLKSLYEAKDYGRYANTDGSMQVCFIATNHTTGGNSGSPVLNAEGHLVGINFDRNWEGTMSDLMYDPDMCRNISLDMRYALFIIDKFAGAGHLVEEMTIIE
jgi:hypothetical protein